jgi:biotin carboxylase
MEIVYDDDGLKMYVGKAALVSGNHPILIDAFLEDAFEFDVDALCDGEDVFVAGIMQHIEEAGIHSGDSACVLPAYELPISARKKIIDYTEKLALTLNTIGLINIQFAMKNGKVYVIEVNPRASRTVPFISKVIDVPLAKIASQLAVGKKLDELQLIVSPGFELKFVKLFTNCQLRCNFSKGDINDLADERNCAASPGIYLYYIHLSIFHGKLNINKTNGIQCKSQFLSVVYYFFPRGDWQLICWKHTC